MRNVPLTLNRIKHPPAVYNYTDIRLEEDHNKATFEAVTFVFSAALSVSTVFAFLIFLSMDGDLSHWGLAWAGTGIVLFAATFMSLISWKVSKTWISKAEAYMEDVVKVTACLKANKLAKGYESIVANQLLTTDLVPLPEKGKKAYLTLKATATGASLVLLKTKRA